MKTKSRIFRSLAASILFVCLCAYAAPAQAFLPPIRIAARICVYQAAYDCDGNFIGAQPVAEKSQLLQHGKQSDFVNIPGLEGYLILDEVDLCHGRPTFTIKRIVEDAVVDCRQFHCEKEIAANTFSCVTEEATPAVRLEKDLWACVIVDIREEALQQGLLLW